MAVLGKDERQQTLTVTQEEMATIEARAEAAAERKIAERTANNWTLAGRIVSLSLKEGKVKMKDGEPVTDENGEPQRWDSTVWIKLAFEGGEESFGLKENVASGIEEGDLVNLTGRFGKYGAFVTKAKKIGGAA